MAKKWLSQDLVKNVLREKFGFYAAVKANLEAAGEANAVMVADAEKRVILEIAKELFGSDAYDIEVDSRKREVLVWKRSDKE